MLSWRRVEIACYQDGYDEGVDSDDSGHDDWDERLLLNVLDVHISSPFGFGCVLLVER